MGWFFVVFLLGGVVGAQVTSQGERVLSRHKRYLTFPMGSNFAITMAYVKSVMQVQPTGWNILGECDVPFPLPSDTRFFKGLPPKQPQRRSIEQTLFHSKFADFLSKFGLDGEACIRRMVCEANELSPEKGQSLVQDLLLAVLMSSDQTACDPQIFSRCNFSFLKFFLNELHLEV